MRFGSNMMQFMRAVLSSRSGSFRRRILQSRCLSQPANPTFLPIHSIPIATAQQRLHEARALVKSSADLLVFVQHFEDDVAQRLEVIPVNFGLVVSTCLQVHDAATAQRVLNHLHTMVHTCTNPVSTFEVAAVQTLMVCAFLN